MRRFEPQPLLAVALLAALAAAGGAMPMPAAGKTGQQAARSTNVLESTIASKLRQLTSLKQDIESAGCEFAADDPSIEACQQLDGQARRLEAEIEELKTRTGPGRASSKVKADKSTGPLLSPPRTKRYTYRWRTNPAASYRTLCVRLCDGFYFPVGSASQPASFLDDEKTCRASCSQYTKLFYQPALADDAGEMVALTGERYADLPNAFRYRSEYVENCACKPKPWSAEAKAEYERRAVLAARNAAERIVAAGADAAAAILAEAEIQVAQRPPVRRAAGFSNARIEQYPAGRGLFWRFRVARHAAGLRGRGPQAVNAAQRRFFLFRNR